MASAAQRHRLVCIGPRLSRQDAAFYPKDVADLSQWIAWMLFSVVAFMAARIKTPHEVPATLRQRAAIEQQL